MIYRFSIQLNFRAVSALTLEEAERILQLALTEGLRNLGHSPESISFETQKLRLRNALEEKFDA